MTKEYAPLETITSPTLTTAAAAFYLNRQPATLYQWASFENGAMQPVRVGGRLAWSVATIRSLLQVN